MKKKNYLIALAIFGGVLFLTQAVNQYDVDTEQTAKIRKKKRRISPAG